MRRGNEQTARGEGVHETMQAEAALMALGHPPDIPLLDIALHLAECAECRRFATEVSEAMGHLPEALEQVRPPASLRAKIVDLAGRDDAAAGDGLNGKTAPRAAAAPATAEPATVAPVARERAVSKRAAGLPRRLRRAVAAAAVLALLIAVNGVWWQHAVPETWPWRSWNAATPRAATVRSAERLVDAEPPAYKGTLRRLAGNLGAAPATGCRGVHDRGPLGLLDYSCRGPPTRRALQHVDPARGRQRAFGRLHRRGRRDGELRLCRGRRAVAAPSGQALVLTVIDESTGEEALRVCWRRLGRPAPPKCKFGDPIHPAFRMGGEAEHPFQAGGDPMNQRLCRPSSSAA